MVRVEEYEEPKKLIKRILRDPYATAEHQLPSFECPKDMMMVSLHSTYRKLKRRAKV